MIRRLAHSRRLAVGISLSLFLVPLIFSGVRSMTDIRALEAIAGGGSDVPIRNLFGQELFIYHSPQYGEKIPVTLGEVSDELIAATIATEDRTFFTNPGFSFTAIVRAIFQNLRMRTTFSGASTITQQIVRNILIPPEERYERTLSRKIKEIILAARITLSYDKEMILTIYLNEIYYGQNATGVEKAAEMYFGKHASELDLSEAAFIAGLPQGPNYYGLDESAGARRQREVLNVMRRIVQEDRCIPLERGPNARSYCPTPDEIELAMYPPEPEK